MMLLGKNQICELRAGGIDFTYHPVPDSDSWKIGFVQELIGIRHGVLEGPELKYEELKIILDYICTE